LIEKVAGQLGGALPIYDVDGDQWKTLLKQELGRDAPSSYPTLLYLAPDGSAIKFKEERTFDNIMAFACLNAGTVRGDISACNAF
jgi:hypothetical protein